MRLGLKAGSLAILAVLFTFPQSTRAADDAGGAWLILATSDHFAADAEAPRWRYWFDGHYRHFERNDGFSQFVLRPAVGYDLNDNVTAWFGYTLVGTEVSGGPDRREQRVWQQLTWSTAGWRDGRLSFRARLMERWRDDGDDMALTARIQAQYALPMGQGLTFAASVEPFVDLRDTDWGVDTGLTQFRTTLGVAFRVNERTRLETGYMHQHFFRDSAQDQANHLAYFNFNLSL